MHASCAVLPSPVVPETQVPVKAMTVFALQHLVALMVLVYPLVVTACLRLVDCTTILTSTGANQQVLRAEPTVVCYTGVHAFGGAVAWLTLLLFCVGFPAIAMYAIDLRALGVPAPLLTRRQRLQAAANGVVSRAARTRVGAAIVTRLRRSRAPQPDDDAVEESRVTENALRLPGRFSLLCAHTAHTYCTHDSTSPYTRCSGARACSAGRQSS